MAVGTIVVLGTVHGWMAHVLSRVDLLTALLGAGLVLAIELVLVALLARVPVYETSVGRDVTVLERRPGERHSD